MWIPCAEIWRYSEKWDPSQFALNHDARAMHVVDGEEIYVSSMTIDIALRGQGKGRRLFMGALSSMFRMYPKARSTILMVNEVWRDARKIYLSEGFKEIGAMEGGNF